MRFDLSTVIDCQFEWKQSNTEAVNNLAQNRAGTTARTWLYYFWKRLAGLYGCLCMTWSLARKITLEITGTLVWARGVKKKNCSLNRCLLFWLIQVFTSASPSACQEAYFKELEKKSTENTQSVWTQQVPPALCAVLKIQRKHKAMKK